MNGLDQQGVPLRELALIADPNNLGEVASPELVRTFEAVGLELPASRASQLLSDFSPDSQLVISTKLLVALFQGHAQRLGKGYWARTAANAPADEDDQRERELLNAAKQKLAEERGMPAHLRAKVNNLVADLVDLIVHREKLFGR